MMPPAAMPGEEEVQFVLAQPISDDDWIVEKARAILALFAPILAEKERLEDELEGTDWHAIEAGRQRDVWKARALAAEAALAAERERCAKVAEDHGELVSNEPIGKACSRNIAAAIRAQGE